MGRHILLIQGHPDASQRHLCHALEDAYDQGGKRSRPGQVQFVIDEVIQCVFEAAREQLPLQVYGKETRAGVNVFVARHAVGAIMHSMTRC